jgi:hypothetical protein
MRTILLIQSVLFLTRSTGVRISVIIWIVHTLLFCVSVRFTYTNLFLLLLCIHPSDDPRTRGSLKKSNVKPLSNTVSFHTVTSTKSSWEGFLINLSVTVRLVCFLGPGSVMSVSISITSALSHSHSDRGFLDQSVRDCSVGLFSSTRIGDVGVYLDNFTFPLTLWHTSFEWLTVS